MKNIVFDYYYMNEAERFAFYRVPKLLITDERFHDVSASAKLLYGLLLDRASLSMANGWIDEQGRVYIFYAVEDIARDLGCGRTKAIHLLGELDTEHGIGLVEKKRIGMGKPNRLYIRKFFTDDDGAEFQKYGIRTSSSTDSELIEVQNMNGNNTDINKTEKNNIYPIISETVSTESGADDQIDRRDSFENQIKENLSFEDLIVKYPYPDQQGLIQDIVTLMTDICCSNSQMILVGRCKMATETVRKRMLDLNIGHIEYVLDAFSNNRTDIHNIRGYLLTMLYNAPGTINAYYAAKYHMRN